MILEHLTSISIVGAIKFDDKSVIDVRYRIRVKLIRKSKQDGNQSQFFDFLKKKKRFFPFLHFG